MKKQRIRKILVIMLPALITVGINMFAYMVPKQVVSPSRYVFLDMEIDSRIPFIPWFVIFYYLAFLQWGNYFLQASFGDRKLRNRYFSADIVSKIIIFIIFMSWPLAVKRPPVDATADFWQWVLSFTFTVDNPLGACPSLHCFYSWMAFRYSLDAEPRERKWITFLQFLLSNAVFASTVLVKQHYFIDVPAGILFAEAALWVVRLTGLENVIGRMFEQVCASAARDQAEAS